MQPVAREKLAEGADVYLSDGGGGGGGERNVSLVNVMKLAHNLNVRPTKPVEAIRQ